MQTETARIKKLLERNWDGPMWHGTNLMTTLKGLTWEQTFSKPQNASHNIYEYVCHMNTWRRFTIEQLNDNSSYTIEINSAEDWPENYDATEANWQKALHQLDENQADLLSGMEQMTDDRLDELVPGRKFKWYALLHGIIHHDIYHSAQISLLKNQK